MEEHTLDEQEYPTEILVREHDSGEITLLLEADPCIRLTEREQEQLVNIIEEDN